MADTYNLQKFLGKKGIAGPIFALSSTGAFQTDLDDNLPIFAKNRAGELLTGFYSVKAIVDDVNFTARIEINGYAPFKRAGKKLTGKQNFLLNPNAPTYSFSYSISNADQIVDGSGAITTPGKYDTFFAKDVVKTAGNCEQWKAIDLILSFNGTSQFQTSHPYSFLTDFSSANITQSNIDATNLLTF